MLNKFIENPILLVQFLYVALTLAILLKSDPVKLDEQEGENCNINMALWALSLLLVSLTLVTWFMMLLNGPNAQVPMLNMPAKKAGALLLMLGISVNALSTDPLGLGVRGDDDEYVCGSIDGVQSFVLGGVALAVSAGIFLGRSSPFGFESRLSYA